MKFAILGAGGSIGQRHAKNLTALGHTIWGVEIDSPEGHREDVLAKCDAVIVATPTKQHSQDLQDAMAANKHVFVEKPIGYDCAPYIAGLIAGYHHKRPDKIVATGFNLRFHEAIIYAKKLLDEGMIGEVDGAVLRVLQKSTKPAYLMDGVVRNWASHEIDIARYLFGNLTFDFAEVEQDAAEVYMANSRGGSVCVMADYITDPEQREYSISGTEGFMRVDVVTRRVVVYKNMDVVHEYQAKDTFDDNYKSEMEAFAHACQSGDYGRLATGMDGCEALDIVCKALGMDYGEWPRL